MSVVRKIYSEFARRSEALSRNRFKLNVAERASGAPRIYFICPDHNVPAGGIRVIYHHVDILNEAGIAAQVLHHSRNFRCDWFENQTSVGNIADTTLSPGDLIVMPEVDGDFLQSIPDTLNCVVFNQNTHLTWQRISAQSLGLQLRRPNMLGCLTVSEHNRLMLQYSYPDIHVDRIHLGIDARLFYPGSGERKNRIGFMPRRGKDDAMQVLEILKARDALRDWEVVPLGGLSHEQVADRLRDCKIFLAFTHQEGFGLPPAEAMACGCYVIGNHGYAGAEFFQESFSSAIENGDVLSFAQAVEEAIQEEKRAPGWCYAKGEEASRSVLAVYSTEREKSEVVDYYRRSLASVGANSISHPERLNAL